MSRLNGLHGYTARGNFYWTATPKLTFNLGMNLANNDNFLSNGDQGTAISIGGFGGNPLTVFRTGSGALDGGWYQSPGVELDRYNSLLQEYHTLRSTPDIEANYKPWSWFSNRLRLGADVSQVIARPVQSDRSRADRNGGCRIGNESSASVQRIHARL